LNYQSFSGGDLQSYMMRMKENIRARWHPPGNAPHAAKIFFQVFADGSLLQDSIQESSGDRGYDDQAKTIIESCAPFGQPPPGSVRLMNIVATFGTDSGGGGGGGNTRGAAIETAPSSATSIASPSTASTVESFSPSDSNSPDSASSSSTHSPLQGVATASGLQSSASSTAAPKFLTGGVGETGTYTSEPLQGQAQAQAPPMYQGQAMAQAPPIFQAQMGMQAPFQAQAQRQQPAFYQSSIQHGQSTIGVLGCEFGMLNNQIRQILPGSDLLRYGIVPGDIIEAADGQALRGKAMQAYVRGTPGTYIQLTIMHQGRVATVPVQRKDAREFSNFSGYFRKWANQEKFW
jgi:hypothetical protein